MHDHDKASGKADCTRGKCLHRCTHRVRDWLVVETRCAPLPSADIGYITGTGSTSTVSLRRAARLSAKMLAASMMAGITGNSAVTIPPK